MDEEEADTGEIHGEGPGREYDLYLKNEELVDKLKLLHYEESFLPMSHTYRSIQKHYFVRPTNAGEQFHLFTALAAWLIRTGGQDVPMPQEFDDPNATISTILSSLRAKDVVVDISSNKLKSGAGEPALIVLDHLADLALMHTNFQWGKMIPPLEEDEDVDVDKDDDDIADNDDEDDEPDIADDDDDAVLVDLAAPTMLEAQDQPLQSILKSDTDAIAWKAEVERVTPLLKITIRQDAKDWRMHLEQMHAMQKNVAELIQQVNPQLEAIASDVEKSLERIESREKSLNSQLSSLLARFRESQDKRAESREKYKSASGGVTQRTEGLQRISEDIDQIKLQIDEQGAKTSDGAPMVKVKQAVLKMEEDINRMNVQIGVIEQSLLQAQLRDRIAYAAESYGAI